MANPSIVDLNSVYIERYKPYKPIESPKRCAKILKSLYINQNSSYGKKTEKEAVEFFIAFLQKNQDLNEEGTAALWGLKISLEHTLGARFSVEFPDLASLPFPQSKSGNLLSHPRLVALPPPPMTNAAKSTFKVRLKNFLNLSGKIEENFVSLENDECEEDFFKARIEEEYNLKEQFMRQVVTRFFQDYIIRSSSLMPEYKMLGFLNISTILQENISFFTQKIGFAYVPEGSDDALVLNEKQKTVLISLLTGLERFVRHFQLGLANLSQKPLLMTLEEERAKENLPQLFTTTMTAFQRKEFLVKDISGLLNNLLTELPQEYKIFSSIGALFLASGLEEFIDSGNAYLFIDHLISHSFEKAPLDPAPPTHLFSAADNQFSERAGELIQKIALKALSIVPTQGVLEFGLKKGRKALEKQKLELGITLQKICNKILSTPDRTGIFYLMSQVFWRVNGEELQPLLPDPERGARLLAAKNELQKKLVEFLLDTISKTMQTHSSFVFKTLEFFKKFGMDYSSIHSPLRKYLEDWTSILFKLLDDKALLFMFLGYLTDDLRCKKTH